MNTVSAFAKYEAKAWPHRFDVTLLVHQLVGGIPTNSRVVEGWLKAKAGMTDETLLFEQVAEVMAQREIPKDEALAEVIDASHLNGFKRDEHGLFIEGRQVKACIKEAASVARASDKLKDRWGTTKKGVLSYVAEHVFVVEDRIPLGRAEPDGIQQRFVHTWRGSSIQYEEFLEKVEVNFTVKTDHDFTEHEWAQLWLTAAEQGIGASRSQGYGRFTVTKFEKVS